MNHIFIISVILTIAANVSALDSRVNITVLEAGTKIFKLNGEEMTVPKFSYPDDDGHSNWGDDVFQDRQDSDVLLLRDVMIYETVSSRDIDLNYRATFDNVRKITSVRALNVGRQRAYVQETDVSSSGVDIYITVPAEVDPRLVIEIYGYKR